MGKNRPVPFWLSRHGNRASQIKKKNDKKDVMTSAEWTHHANTSTDRPEKCPSSENTKQPVHRLQVLVIDQWMLQRTLSCLSQQSESGYPSIWEYLEIFKIQKGIFSFRCASLLTDDSVLGHNRTKLQDQTKIVYYQIELSS